MSLREAGSPKPSSNPESTTRSSANAVLLNGNAGRPKTSSASSLTHMGQGAVSIAIRTALTPLEPPTVIVFQVGMSRAVGALGVCFAVIGEADTRAAGGLGHGVCDCAVAFPVYRTTANTTATQCASRQL